MTTTQRSAIETANATVSIAFVCNLIGMGIPDLDVMSGKNYKTYCPFGDVSHDDAGQSKAFRVYPDTNSAYCFACSEYYSPVKLYAMSQDISSWTDAADQLLVRAGHHAVADHDARWEAAVSGPPEQVDTSVLAEALKTYCARIDGGWTHRQFEEPWSGWLDRCLSLLQMVRTRQDAQLWLTQTKLVMERELKEEHGTQ